MTSLPATYTFAFQNNSLGFQAINHNTSSAVPIPISNQNTKPPDPLDGDLQPQSNQQPCLVLSTSGGGGITHNGDAMEYQSSEAHQQGLEVGAMAPQRANGSNSIISGIDYERENAFRMAKWCGSPSPPLHTHSFLNKVHILDLSRSG